MNATRMSLILPNKNTIVHPLFNNSYEKCICIHRILISIIGCSCTLIVIHNEIPVITEFNLIRADYFSIAIPITEIVI